MNGLMYCLVQPQNLVLTGEFPDCDVKLCDFGISRYLSQGVDVREILGTPDYVGKCNKCNFTSMKYVHLKSVCLTNISKTFN